MGAVWGVWGIIEVPPTPVELAGVDGVVVVGEGDCMMEEEWWWSSSVAFGLTSSLSLSLSP